jgi:hypothetical protein
MGLARIVEHRVNLETQRETERVIAEYSRTAWAKLRRDPLRQTARIVRRRIREWKQRREFPAGSGGDGVVRVPAMLQPPPLRYAGHEGPWFDDYFLRRSHEEVFKGAKYLPVLWANFFAQAQAGAYLPAEFALRFRAIGRLLAELEQREEVYFTVLGIYDFPIWNWHLFPKNVLVYSANGYGDVAIPLLSMDRPFRNPQKKMVCSFLGRTETHPLRDKMRKVFSPEAAFDFGSHWEEVMGSSTFSLCPRGQGPTSLRIHEAMSLCSIPVYIWEKWKWLPYADEVDWDSFAVVVEVSKMEEAKQRVLAMGPQEIRSRQDKIASIYPSKFTFAGLRDWITSSTANFRDRKSAEELAACRAEAVC